MKIQIRQGAWETNSSSVHTFCFSTKGLKKCHMKIHNDGYVHVVLNQYFGTDEAQFFAQKIKLKYILTWIYVYYGCDKEKFEESYLFKDFNEQFAKYVTNHNGMPCLGIMVDGYKWSDCYDYFDHQQLNGGWVVDNCLVSIWNSEACVEFIFNKYIGLKTGCD